MIGNDSINPALCSHVAIPGTGYDRESEEHKSIERRRPVHLVMAASVSRGSICELGPPTKKTKTGATRKPRKRKDAIKIEEVKDEEESYMDGDLVRSDKLREYESANPVDPMKLCGDELRIRIQDQVSSSSRPSQGL